MSKRKSSNRARRAKKPGSGRGNGRIIRARDADDLDLGEDVGAIGYGRRHATADEAAEIDIAPPGGRGNTAASGLRQSAAHPRGRANTGAAHARSRSGAKPAPSSHAQHESQVRAPRSSSRAGAAAGAIGVLTCTAGPEEGLGLTLTEGVYGIGRGRDNHFVLKDIAASRQHVEIRVHNGQVTVYDLGSGNGTRVNGKRIQQAALKPGDRVEIGNSALTFSAMGQIPSGQREAALVPPDPAPRPQDLWPETETLLSELKEFESRVAARPRTGHTGEASLLTRPGRPRPTRPQQPQQQQPAPARPQPGAELDPSATMAEIQAAIGSSSRSGSMGWLLMGALIIVVLLGGAATVVYVTVVRSSDVEQARVMATKGSLALAQGQFDDARKNIEEALRLDPKNEEAQASLDLLNRNEQSERSYRRAQEMLDEDEYRDARHALEGIKEGTPRFKDLPELERKIDQQEAAELAKKAQRALEANDLDKADKLVTRALDLDGDNERARTVQDAIIKAKARPLEAVKPDDRAGATKDESWTAQEKTDTKKTSTKKTSTRKTSKKKTSKKKTSKNKPDRKSASSSLSDDDADDLFRQAVRAYKEDDLKKSRRLMNKVIKGTKPGSKYHLKASSFIDRRL